MSLFNSVGWGVDQSVGGFGDEPGIKVQLMNLIRSVRTVMRGVLSVCLSHTRTHTHLLYLSVYLMLNTPPFCLPLSVLPCSAVDSSEFSVHRFASSVWMKMK